MASIIKRPSWYLPDSAATDEDVFFNRRDFLKMMGAGATGVGAGGIGGMMAGGLAMSASAQEAVTEAVQKTADLPLPAYARNPKFADVGRALTEEYVGTTFNNFWEFSYDKAVVYAAEGFDLNPYTLRIDGLVDKPMVLDLDDIEKLGYEERVYRFRCVEAWSMTVPWLGVPLAKLVALAQPKSTAKFVLFKSFYNPKVAPNQSNARYKWPYHEGLRIDEAMDEMGFVATGAYGRRLRPQSGTPLRIITPWKYGYKGPKSVVSMTFVDEQPSTFWSAVLPKEYPFYSNVDPQLPHPRWSQATEKFITDKANLADVELIPTLRYNGYEEQVGHLYKDMPRILM